MGGKEKEVETVENITTRGLEKLETLHNRVKTECKKLMNQWNSSKLQLKEEYKKTVKDLQKRFGDIVPSHLQKRFEDKNDLKDLQKRFVDSGGVALTQSEKVEDLEGIHGACAKDFDAIKQEIEVLQLMKKL